MVPLSLVAIAIGAMNIAGRGDSQVIFAIIASRDFPLGILALLLTVGSTLYVLERSRDGGGLGLHSSQNFGIAVLEVEEMPPNYLLREPLIDEKWTQIFDALVRNLTLREQPFCLHIHYEEGKGKIRILLRKRPQDTDDYLISLVQSQLPGFTLTKGQEVSLPSSLENSVRQIKGNPQQFTDEVTTNVSEFFELSRSTGDYIAIFKPFKPSLVRRSILKRKFKGRTMRIKTERAIGGADAAEQTIYFIEKLAACYALRTHFYIVARSERRELADQLADDIMALVRGAFSNDAKDIPEMNRVNPDEFHHNFEKLSPIGRPAILNPVEARALFQFPRPSLGIAATERAGRPLPSVSDEVNPLESLQVDTREIPEEKEIPIEAVAKQALLAGSSGSGKTSLVFDMLLDAYHNQIPFIVFAPVKREYRALINVMPESLLFTICKEQVTPLRFNPLLPPSGTLNQAHVENFRAAFEASYALHPPMPYVLSQCLTNVYMRNGWNLLGHERGEIIMPTDLCKEVEDYTRSLGYEADLKKDIEVALIARLERLTEGALGAMLNTTKPFPTDLFLSAPTIFEFEDLADDGQKALIIALLMIAIREQVQMLGPSKSIRLIIVIEEAHRLLTNIDTIATLPDAAEARKGAIQYISNMLAEMRAYGVGTILVDQMPSKLFPDAIKNTGTKVVFRLVSDGDRKILGAAMNLDEGTMRSLLSQRVGEATVFTENMPHAYKIRIPDVVKAHGIKTSINVTDEELKEHMQTYYQHHPLNYYQQQVRYTSSHKRPVDVTRPAPKEVNTSLCAICSPNVGNCILQYLASEVLSNQDVQVRMTERLSSNTFDIEEFADYLLKLSETVLGERNLKLSYCLLAKTQHENVVKIAKALHRTLKIRIKQYSENNTR